MNPVTIRVRDNGPFLIEGGPITIIDAIPGADPTSPTGRRINASFIAPTALESSVRRDLGRLDGWGTYQPITVAFEEPLDLDALVTAQGGDAYS